MSAARTRIGIVAIALAAPATSIADPVATLETRGDACDLSRLPAEVAELVGRDPFVYEAPLGVVVTVERDGDRVRATIVLASGGTMGRRVLDDATCDALFDSIGLSIAMALAEGPDVHASADEPPPPEPSPPPPPPRPSVVASPSPATPELVEGAAMPSAPLAPEMHAGVAGGIAGRDVLAGVVVGAAIRRGRASVGLSFALTAPDRVAIGPGSVSVTTGTFELAGCAHRGAFAGCVTFAGGWVRGAGAELTDASTRTTPFVAPGLRVAWDHDLSARVAARVQVAIRAPLTRNRFLVDDMAVWSTVPVEAWLGLGLVARIP